MAAYVFLHSLHCSIPSCVLLESYGLWFAKRWAEWFALLSGSVYLPVELYGLLKGVTWIKCDRKTRINQKLKIRITQG